MPLSPAGWIIVMVSSLLLRSLHWLPVTFRIDFKVLLLVYKSLNGIGPKYMAEMLTEYKPNRPLRSLGSSQLEIPRVHTKQGESAFSYYAARSWNQLPEEIRCAKTLATFKSRLKTHLSPSWELELRPLGVATGNALSVTRSEDTYEKTPPVGRRQPMTSLPACHNISAAGRKHHQLFRLH